MKIFASSMIHGCHGSAWYQLREPDARSPGPELAGIASSLLKAG